MTDLLVDAEQSVCFQKLARSDFVVQWRELSVICLDSMTTGNPKLQNYETAGGDRLSVLFVMAADPEYGPQLSRRIAPFMTGVGPVEAAAATARALACLEADGRKPDLVVSLGSCGSRRLGQGTIVQVASVGYRDMDASPLGFARGCTPFLDHPADIPIRQRLPGLKACRLSTGAAIVSGAGYADVDAEIVDMETFANLRACHHAGIPLIGLRGVSDGREDLQTYSDWADYLHAVDENLAAVIDRLPAMIATKPRDYWTRVF